MTFIICPECGCPLGDGPLWCGRCDECNEMGQHAREKWERRKRERRVTQVNPCLQLPCTGAGISMFAVCSKCDKAHWDHWEPANVALDCAFLDRRQRTERRAVAKAEPSPAALSNELPKGEKYNYAPASQSGAGSVRAKEEAWIAISENHANVVKQRNCAYKKIGALEKLLRRALALMPARAENRQWLADVRGVVQTHIERSGTARRVKDVVLGARLRRTGPPDRRKEVA